MDTAALVDLFERRKAERGQRLSDFVAGKRPYLVLQRPPADLWGACNTVDMIVGNNLAYMERALRFDWTDELPYLEPWIGTGLFASAFGCEYMWRDDNAPDIHYRYHKIEEVAHLEYPDWNHSPVMRMVLNCIDAFLEKTGGRLPIALTDTQSPVDTATLVLDAVEFFTACYTHEEIVLRFLDIITRLIIEFSQVQECWMGAERRARPGHIMPADTNWRGISISEDNLSFCSPRINAKFALPFDQKIADAFDGLAVHSCGNWVHTMKLVRQMRNILMVDCSLPTDPDPTPNVASEVRDAMKGSGIPVKARVGSNPETFMPVIAEVFDPGLRLVLEIGYDEANAARNYHLVNDFLARQYGV